MKPEHVLRDLKRLLKCDIDRLQKKVKDPEENTYCNGALEAREVVLERIERLEAMPDWYGERNHEKV